MPVTLIGESVFARCLSAIKEERVEASKILTGPTGQAATADRADFIENVRRALYCSKIISYAQGYMLLREAAKAFGWSVNMGGIALMWRGGCIIRSRFLGKIKDAYDKKPDLHSLLFDSFFSGVLNEYQASWRKAVVKAIALGVPASAFSTALAFYDGYRTARLPANLLQAQRDFFGAHTYERVDRPRGQFFHTNWTGRGGRVSSYTYNVKPKRPSTPQSRQRASVAAFAVSDPGNKPLWSDLPRIFFSPPGSNNQGVNKTYATAENTRSYRPGGSVRTGSSCFGYPESSGHEPCLARDSQLHRRFRPTQRSAGRPDLRRLHPRTRPNPRHHQRTG